MHQPNRATPAFLPAQWATARLAIRDCSLPDTPRLQAIFNACHYVEPWDKTFYLVSEQEIAELVRQSLRVDDEHRRFRLQCICLRQEPDIIVGYVHLHHGVPTAQLVFISMFVMHPDYQQQHFGQEIIAGLAAQLQSLGYEALRLDIFLKNWPALRFWIKAGFTTILEYEGDATHTPTGHASLLLEHRLGL
ncbi:MAG: GNAT family N-acetyltransferase [Caldilineaceae bacterium]